MKNFYFWVLILFSNCILSQNISLFQQFNGRFDFTIIGNTMNLAENNSVFGQPAPNCQILTQSAATLNLNSNEIIEKAYLYWAGSGAGVNQIKLNNQVVVASEMLNIVQSTSNLTFFRAIKDITPQVLATGNGLYTVSEFDLTTIIPQYCQNATNFAGWGIVIVYKNENLPNNQLNIYSGLNYVGFQNNSISINLNSLNVIDNVGAKIGFLAWEGDKNIAEGESLKINGTPLSNAINPANNAFNGTNSITAATNLYNMDIDVYDIQGFINIGDSSANIQLTSDRDFVMISTVVTKLNSQLPDATIAINNYETTCDSRILKVNYTVSNLLGTNPLPANVSIAIYANDTFIQTTNTFGIIPINGSENGSVLAIIPALIPPDFVLKFVVDSNQNGIGSITEIIETNNTALQNVSLLVLPKFNVLPNLSSCDKGLTRSEFDFSDYRATAKVNPLDEVRFFETSSEANANSNSIINVVNYNATATPKTIFVRITDSNNCYSITEFQLFTKKCPPIVYNFVSSTPDSLNDVFFVSGLRNVFLNFNMSISNRNGVLVWTGNNNSSDWTGTANQGFLASGNQLPEGTYFYILNLNDAEYPAPLNGFVYLTR